MKNPQTIGAITAMVETLALATAAPAAHAADFAPAGAKATLSIEYRYESNGKVGPSKDKVLELHEWQVQRQVDLKADLVAAKPLPTPVMQAIDGAPAARMQQQGAQVQRAATQMAPMMAGAEAIVTKCGNDEKCMEREAMKMGSAMSGTQQLDDTLKTGRQTAAAMQPGDLRYQAWRVAAQGGTYRIEQSAHTVHRDPACMVNPGARCNRRHVGKGEGALPQPPQVPAIHAAEFDMQAQTITLQLPASLMPLPYNETVSSDEPKGAQVVPPGTHQRQMLFRVTGDGKATPDKAFTLALKGGWRTQSGDQTVQVKGEAGEGGTLRVRWKFVAQ